MATGVVVGEALIDGTTNVLIDGTDNVFVLDLGGPRIVGMPIYGSWTCPRGFRAQFFREVILGKDENGIIERDAEVVIDGGSVFGGSIVITGKG